jgi:hypothetical protein
MSRLDDPKQVSETELSNLSEKFQNAMNRARRIFGRYAFRKYYGSNRRLSPINKALFESMSCALAGLSEDEAEKVEGIQQVALQAYAQLNNDLDFSAAISQGTGDPIRVRRRFARMENMFRTILKL